MLFSHSVSSASMSRFWPGAVFSERTAGIFSISSNHDYGQSAGNGLATSKQIAGSKAGYLPINDPRVRLSRDRSIAHELNVRLIRNDAALVPHLQQLTNRLASVLAVVESPFVHIHTDKFVGLLHVKIPGKLHGVLQCLFSVIQGVLDAVTQRIATGIDQGRAKIALDRVPAQR